MASQPEQQQQYNMNELMNDEELQKLHEERIARLKEEREKRSQLAQKGHGEVTEITEGEFLEVVTQTDNVVCHLFHRDFERCKIMDKHLSILARKYFRTRFIKLSAPVRGMQGHAIRSLETGIWRRGRRGESAD